MQTKSITNIIQIFEHIVLWWYNYYDDDEEEAAGVKYTVIYKLFLTLYTYILFSL